MTTDDFETAARAEAEALVDDIILWDDTIATDGPCDGTWDSLAAYLAVRGWARTHLAAQEPDMAEQEARWVVEHKHQFHGSQCVCGFETERARTRTEHIMTHYFDEVRAARAARRDEEKR